MAKTKALSTSGRRVLIGSLGDRKQLKGSIAGPRKLTGSTRPRVFGKTYGKGS